MMRYIILILTTLCLATTGQGQTMPDTVQIREVKVFARRNLHETGLSISRLDSMAVVSAISSHLSELLSQNTPIFMKSYGRGSMATASFRGTSASHTKLLWNGMNLNSPMRGSADLSLAPVLFVDEVWLLHGGSSLTENTGSLGGSIYLANQADWLKNNTAAAVMERVSFSSGTYLLRFQTGKGRFRSVTRLMADHSENNYTFYNVGILPYRSDTLENADFIKMAALQEFYVRLGDSNQLALRFWGQISDRNLPQLMSYEGSEKKETQSDEQLRVMAEFKSFRSNVKYHYFSGLNYSSLQYFRSTLDPWFVNEDARSSETSLYNRLKINADLNNEFHLSGSAEYNYHRVEATGRFNPDGYQKKRMEAGFMAHLQYRPILAWGFFALLRNEWYDAVLIPFIPSAGAEYNISGRYPATIKINAARNYHKPTLNELYWIPGGNPDLKAEDGLTADISFHVESPEAGLLKQQISLFYSRIDNWIIWQPAASGAWYWEAANIREVLSRGIEYQMSSRFNISKTLFQFSANYAFTKSTNEQAVSSFDKSRGKQLIYIPKHTGNLHGSASIKDWTIKGDIHYTGRRYTQSSNEWTHFESVLNPFWVTSASMERKYTLGIWNLSARLKAENLFNINYQQILWRPMPGRHYSLILSVRWNS